MPIVHHRKPSLLSYPLWLGSRAVLRPLMSWWPLTEAGMAGLTVIDKLVAAGPKPRGVVREPMTLAGRRVELIMPTGPSRRDSETAVLYLHGGAFVVCGIGSHRYIAAKVSQTYELPVFSLEYRQLPGAGVGTSAFDAVAAYRELVTERGFRRVIVAGDSAGGFLAMKIVEAARREGLVAPIAVIGFSPLLDLDVGTNPDRSSRSDAYIPQEKMAKLAPKLDRGPEPLLGVRRIADLVDEDFPPTIIVTAEAEMIEADAIELVEMLDEVGVEAQVHSYAWQVHVFPVILAVHPETRDAIETTAAFAADAIREAKDADSRKDRRAG